MASPGEQRSANGRRQTGCSTNRRSTTRGLRGDEQLLYILGNGSMISEGAILGNARTRTGARLWAITRAHQAHRQLQPGRRHADLVALGRRRDRHSGHTTHHAVKTPGAETSPKGAEASPEPRRYHLSRELARTGIGDDDPSVIRVASLDESHPVLGV